MREIWSLRPTGATSGGPAGVISACAQHFRGAGNELADKGTKPRQNIGGGQNVAEITSQSAHVAEIPGFQTGEPTPSHRSNKYLKTGPKTRRPAGLAAGADRPRWLRWLERFYGWAEGGAWPERNRRWMERERGRRSRQKLPSTPKTNKRKPGQAPRRAGPASASPAGRTRARAKADSGWECHAEIE